MKRFPFPTLLTATMIVAVLVLSGITFSVRFSDVAVRVVLGKADEKSVITQPGFYWRWPWPIEMIQFYDNRLRTIDTPESEIKTRDGKNVIVSCYAIWRIQDPLKFYVRVNEEAEAARQLRTRIGQVRAAAIGIRDMSYFVNLDQAAVDRNYDELESELLAAAAPDIERDYGIEVVKIGIRRVSLPEQVTQTVFRAMIANANKLVTRYRVEGQGQAAAITAQADQDARQILAFAGSKAEEIRSTGIQASTEILSQIEQGDVEFYELLRWLDSLRIALAERSTIFLDSDDALFGPFTRPLSGLSVPTPRLPEVHPAEKSAASDAVPAADDPVE